MTAGQALGRLEGHAGEQETGRIFRSAPGLGRLGTKKMYPGSLVPSHKLQVLKEPFSKAAPQRV